MLSRRDVLVGGLMAGMCGVLSRTEVAHAVAAQPRTKVNFDVPPGSCDSSVHVFGDPKRYPFWEGRAYTPEPATVGELRQVMQALRLDRVVVVQASPYGTDNSCVMDSVRELGTRARGVAIIDEHTPEASLDEMHRGGVRGIRIILNNLAVSDPAEARQRVKVGVDRVKNRPNWSIQITALPPTFDVLRDQLNALPVPLVIDHFGEVRAAEGVGQPGFATIVSLVKSGKAYVKISHAQALSRQPDLSDMAPYAKALIAANPERILWGTAWPHPSAGSVPGRKPTDLALHQQFDVDDGRVLNLLPVWAPDASMRRMILVENPARLYGF